MIPDVSWVFSTVAGPAGKTKRVTIRDIHNGRIFWKVDLRNALIQSKKTATKRIGRNGLFKDLNLKFKKSKDLFSFNIFFHNFKKVDFSYNRQII